MVVQNGLKVNLDEREVTSAQLFRHKSMIVPRVDSCWSSYFEGASIMVNSDKNLISNSPPKSFLPDPAKS